MTEEHEPDGDDFEPTRENLYEIINDLGLRIQHLEKLLRDHGIEYEEADDLPF